MFRSQTFRASMLCLGTVVLSLTLASELQAQSAKTLYVRSSGSDSNNGRSAGTAFRTVAKAAAIAGPGTTVFVGAGTYSEALTSFNSGTANKPIRFIADPTGEKTGDAGRVDLSGGIQVVNRQAIHFTGFRITGGSGEVINWRGSSGLLSFCEIVGGRNGVTVSGGSLNVSRCTIRNNTSDGITITSSAEVDISNCLVVRNADNGIELSSGRATIQHVTAAYNGDDGIDVDGGTSSVTNCISAFNKDNGFDGRSGRTTHSHNLAHGNGKSNFNNWSQADSELEADPTFVDPSQNDFRLQNGSPAIDVATGSMAIDMVGNKRPFGNGIDMGCYEGGTAAATGLNYYVRKSGNDGSDGRSPETAFQTIGKATSVAKPGETIYVGAGNYSQTIQFSNNGKPDAPIQLIADRSGAHTGDQGDVNVSGYVHLQNRHYLVIDGFAVQSSGSYGLYCKGATNNLIKNCSFKARSYVAIAYGGEITLSDCQLRGGYVGLFSQSAMVTLTNTLCEDSYYGCYVQRGTFTAEKVTSRNNRYHGMYLIYATSVTVSRSTVTGNGYYGVVDYNYDAGRYGGDHTITNCLIAQNGQLGIYAYAYRATTKIEHCTISDNQHYGALLYYNGCSITNSILANHRRYGLYDSQARHSHNLYYKNGRDTLSGKLGKGEFRANPEFKSSDDYHLKPNSPAIDRAAKGDLAIDLDGKPRPAGKASDLGCYEAGSGSAIYYVSTSGDDLQDGRTLKTAFRTITKAAEMVQPGDEVKVSPGTYRENPVLQTAGKKDELIKFTANGGPVKLVSANSSAWTFQLNKADLVEVDGFHVMGASNGSGGYGPAFRIEQSDGVVLRNCRFEEASSGVSSEGSSVRLESCQVRRTTAYSVTSVAGSMVLENCVFQSNQNGPWSDSDKSFRMLGTKVTGTTDWSLIVKRRAGKSRIQLEVQNCTFRDNANGLFVENFTTQRDLQFRNTEIEKPNGFELHLQNCVISLDSRWKSNWPITGGKSGISCFGGEVSLAKITFKGHERGLLAEQVKLSVKGCVFDDNATGLLATESIVQMQGVVGRNNDVSIQIGDSAIRVKDIQLSGAKHYGLALGNCEGVIENCKAIDNEGSGIYSHGAKHPLILNATSSGNAVGVAAVEGELVLRNSRLHDNATGVSGHDVRLVIDNSSVEKSTQYGYWISQSSLEFQNQEAKIVNNAAGIRVEGRSAYPKLDKIRLSGIRIADNQKAGVIKDRCDLLLADCTIENNGDYGVNTYHAGNVTIVNSAVKGHTHGLSHHTPDIDANQQPIRIQVVVEDSTFSDGQNGILGAGVLVTLRNSEFSNFSKNGVWTSGAGAHRVEDATFTNCFAGFSANFMDSFIAQRSKFTGTPIDGASLLLQFKDGAKATLEDCTLSDSKGTGLAIYTLKNQDDLFLKNTTITNNGAGLALSNCTLTFDQNDQRKWSGMTNNYITFQTSGGNLTFDNYTITGAKGVHPASGSAGGTGIYAQGTALTFKDSEVRQNTRNGVISFHPLEFTAANTVFQDEVVALQIYRELPGNQRPAEDKFPVKLNDCTFRDNVYGPWLTHVTSNSFEIKNTAIVDNDYGLLLSTSDLLMDQSRDGWTIDRNRLAINAGASNLTIQNSAIRDSEVGLHNYQGQLTLRDSLIEGGDMGVVSLDHTDLAIDGCTINKGTRDGAWLAFYQNHYGPGGSGGTAADQESGLLSRGSGNIRNSVIAGFDKGVHSESTSLNPLGIFNTTLANCGKTGIDVLSGNAVVKNTIIAGLDSSGSVAMKRRGGSLDHGYNLIHGFLTAYQGTTEGEEELLKNPRFASNSYALGKGSPAINAGTDLSSLGILADITGNSRPSFKVFEIGAYEYLDPSGAFRIVEWKEQQ